MPEQVHFTVDAGMVAFKTDAPGVSMQNDELSFDWDDVEVVRIDDVPWADAFKTKEFYKLPATVAKPVKQHYMFGSDMVTLMKPRDELKKAAWSLHNAPWTLNHPDGMVKDIDDIRGFWRDPRYIDSLDDLDADLHIPVNDDDAKQFVEQNGDVSVGFYNRMVAVDQYDGIVGGEDDKDGVRAYQTNLYFDHIASVRVGRCSSEAGCGIHDGTMVGEYINVPCITNMNEDMQELDASKFVNPDDDKWYAVPPGDNTDDEWKYPINNCQDVQDAWKLRGHGKGLSISQETLESRIKSRAKSLDCPVPGDNDD